MTQRFQRGDIILVRFPFTDLSGSKRRPAIVLAEYLPDVVVAFISSIIPAVPEPSDVLLLQPSRSTGLKKASVIRLRKLATLEEALVTRRLGKLDKGLVTAVDQALLQGLGIDTSHILREEYQKLAAMMQIEGDMTVLAHIHFMTEG